MSDTADPTTVPVSDGCDQFVDDGRDETLLMHRGTELESVSTMRVNLTDPDHTMNPVSKFVLQMVKDDISLKGITRTRMAKHCKGVIDEKIADVLKMKECYQRRVAPLRDQRDWLQVQVRQCVRMPFWCSCVRF